MMSDKKCRQVLNFYRLFVELNGAKPVIATSNSFMNLYELRNKSEIVANDPTDKNCNNILELIKSLLLKEGAEPQEADYDACFTNKQEAMNHLLSMLPKMAQFIIQCRQEKFMRWLGFIIGSLASNEHISNQQIAFNHLLWMSSRMKEYIMNGDRMNFMLWLGVMQGIFCSYGVFTLNEIKNHSKPDDEPETP